MAAEKKKDSALWETVKTVIFAVVIAIGIRTVAYEPFKIPSGSMRPTLLIGDYLFVSKFSYGYSKYSLPFDLPIIPGRIFFTEPERGDVVVFRPPGEIETNFIKRLVGLPGDKIELRHGRLYINDNLIDRQPTTEYKSYKDLGLTMLKVYEEDFGDAGVHTIHEFNDNQISDNVGPYIVPDEKYFLMGDNRDRSSDSRFGPAGHPGSITGIMQQGAVGYVPAENLIGRADFLFFSIDRDPKVDGSILKFWNWPFWIRWSRLFNTIN